MKCKDCKHWDKEEYFRIYLDPDNGKCKLISDSYYNDNTLARTFAGYDLITKPEFGCNLFENKETGD